MGTMQHFRRSVLGGILAVCLALTPWQMVFAMELQGVETVSEEPVNGQPAEPGSAALPGEQKEQTDQDDTDDVDDVDDAEQTAAAQPSAADGAPVAADFDQLLQVIADTPDGGEILIANDFELHSAVELDKSLVLRAQGNGRVTLRVSGEHRHLLVTGGAVTLDFDGIVLDGGNRAGGIRSEADHLILNNAVIRNCHSTDSQRDLKQTLGGAVNATGDVTIAGNTEISGNRAGSGGGVYGHLVTVEGGEIYNNTATSSGGGVGTYGESGEVTLIMNGGRISGNTARDNGGAFGRVVEMNGGEISDNTAQSAGGIGAHDAMTMTGGLITRNRSTELGMYAGGVYSNDFTMTGGEISDNTAADRGGALYTLWGNVLIDGGVITGNTAMDGGGICTYSLGTLQIRGDSVVADNQADQAYYITDEDDIALHRARIDGSATWTEGFDYIYNNHDVMYTKGSTEPIIEQHNVTVVLRYLDDALPESSRTYQVDHGAAFQEPFEVLEGYDLYGMQTFSMPIINADMDAKLVSISEVNQDYTIELEFDKIQYRVQVVTRYLDNALPEKTETYWVRYGDAFSAPFTVLEGYDLYGMQTLSMPVIDADMNTKTVRISEVKQDYTIVLEFDKAIYNVKVVVRYEDGSKEDVVDLYHVKHGEAFETTFAFELGYSIRNISVNAVGVAVDRNTRTVKINRVVSDVEAVITLR